MPKMVIENEQNKISFGTSNPERFLKNCNNTPDTTVGEKKQVILIDVDFRDNLTEERPIKKKLQNIQDLEIERSGKTMKLKKQFLWEKKITITPFITGALDIIHKALKKYLAIKVMITVEQLQEAALLRTSNIIWRYMVIPVLKFLGRIRTNEDPKLSVQTSGDITDNV